MFERVIGMGIVIGRAPITAHIRSDAAEAEGGKAAELVAPAVRQFGPAMNENDQRPALGPAGEIKIAVPRGFGEVLGHHEEHGVGAFTIAHRW